MYSDITYIIENGVIAADTLAGLADKVNRPGDLEDPLTIGNVNGAVLRADDLIDSYIRAVYDGVLPLAAAPETIKSASAEIACYLLWQSTNVPHEENPLAEKYDFWTGWLTKLAKGVVVLSLGDTPVTTNSSVSTATRKVYADRRFTPETLKGVF